MDTLPRCPCHPQPCQTPSAGAADGRSSRACQPLRSGALHEARPGSTRGAQNMLTAFHEDKWSWLFRWCSRNHRRGRWFTSATRWQPNPVSAGEGTLVKNLQSVNSLCWAWAKSSARWLFHPVVFCPVTQSCPSLCDRVNCRKARLPCPPHLPELAQTHVHQIGDATQPSHPLPSPSPPAFNLSQHLRYLTREKVSSSSHGQQGHPCCPPSSDVLWKPSLLDGIFCLLLWPFLASMFFLWGWVSFHHSSPSEVFKLYSFF